MEKQIIKKEIINQKRDKEHENKSTFILQYIYFIFGFQLLEKILVSIMILAVYTGIFKNFSYVFIPLITTQSISFLIN